MQVIRIIIGKVPNLLREIITAAFSKEKGVRIVGEVESEGCLVDLCARMQPNVVVLGSLDADAEGIGHRLLNCCPFAKIFALTSDGRTTSLYELRPQKVHFGELSPMELGRVVTSAVQTTVGPMQ